MKLRNKKGFTLTELIVVIAIIAILSAVLIPALSGYIGKAKQSALDQEFNNITREYQAYLTEKSVGSLKTSNDTFPEYYYDITKEELPAGKYTFTATNLSYNDGKLEVSTPYGVPAGLADVHDDILDSKASLVMDVTSEGVYSYKTYTNATATEGEAVVTITPNGAYPAASH